MKDTKKISKMIKRTFALALTGSLLLTAVGCGKGSVGGTSAKSKEGTNENYAFKGSEFQVSSADGMLESMTQSDDKVYMLFETFSEVATGTDSGREDAFNGKIATKIVSVPKEGGETEILYESEPSDDGVYTSALSLDKDGTPVVVQSNMGNKGDEFYHICSVKDGKLETLRDVTELFKEAEWSSTIILDDKDNLITVADNEFKVYDPNNKEIASQYFGDVWISGFGRSASGDIVVTADDYSDDQEVAKLYVFDKESYEQKKEVKLDTRESRYLRSQHIQAPTVKSRR